MDNELSPVETLREIRARFAALQATLEEAQEEEGKANATLIAEMAENDRLRAEINRLVNIEHIVQRFEAFDIMSDMVGLQRVELDMTKAELKNARALGSMKDDALASMVEIYEKIQTYLGIDPGDMGERADGEILHRIHVLNGRTAELEAARARIAELEADGDKLREEMADAVDELTHRRENFNIMVQRLIEKDGQIRELESALKGLTIAAANDMRHGDDGSDMGWLALRELSEALAAANRLTQHLPTTPATEARVGVCAWEYDDIDRYWQSACGLQWVMEEMPAENEMNFCPKCGSHLWVSSLRGPEVDG